MTDNDTQISQAFSFAVKQAYAALRKGNRRTARRWAQQAAALAPEREEAWLILASVASPKASIHYLEQALAINPDSDRARKGMHWAVKRLRAAEPARAPAAAVIEDTAETPVPAAPAPEAGIESAPTAEIAIGEEVLPVPAKAPDIQTHIRPEDRLRRRSVLAPLLAAATFVCLIVAVWFSSPMLVQALASPQFAAALLQPTETSVPTATALPTETFTPAPTETPQPSVTPLPSLTPKPTNTPTATPTDTPTPTPTNTPLPTPVPTLVPTQPPPSVFRPEGVGADENWIDVDLSEQILRAYTGDTLMRTFVVSTGTWATPTVTGTYRVYVKYTYADMSGPGYYLANVPFVMYFYQGYGIHGTYWHNNFGTPMSHGCVNMTIDDAGWMFDFSVIGTVVHVHN